MTNNFYHFNKQKISTDFCDVQSFRDEQQQCDGKKENNFCFKIATGTSLSISRWIFIPPPPHAPFPCEERTCTGEFYVGGNREEKSKRREPFFKKAEFGCVLIGIILFILYQYKLAFQTHLFPAGSQRCSAGGGGGHNLIFVRKLM